MTHQEYLDAVQAFVDCREKMMELALGLDRETALRNPHRINNSDFLDIFTERKRATNLIGIAEHSVKVADACAKLTDDDLWALGYADKPAVQYTPPPGVPDTLQPKTNTPFIQWMKDKIASKK